MKANTAFAISIISPRKNCNISPPIVNIKAGSTKSELQHPANSAVSVGQPRAVNPPLNVSPPNFSANPKHVKPNPEKLGHAKQLEQKQQ